MDNALQPEAPLQNIISAEQEAGLHPKAPGRRYHWKWVNFSRFLYDEVEDLYIPESVYRMIFKS